MIGEGARTNLFGVKEPLGQYVKVNEVWFRVIGVAGPQVSSETDVAGIPAQDRNNLIYVPTGAAMFRLEDTYSSLRDEIDGVYVRVKADADINTAAATVRRILEASHRGADDFGRIGLADPAGMAAQQAKLELLGLGLRDRLRHEAPEAGVDAVGVLVPHLSEYLTSCVHPRASALCEHGLAPVESHRPHVADDQVVAGQRQRLAHARECRRARGSRRRARSVARVRAARKRSPRRGAPPKGARTPQ